MTKHQMRLLFYIQNNCDKITALNDDIQRLKQSIDDKHREIAQLSAEIEKSAKMLADISEQCADHQTAIDLPQK